MTDFTIGDLRFPCDEHHSHGHGCLKCAGGRVPTRQVLIDMLVGVWCDVDWDHSTGGRVQLHDAPSRYALVKVDAALGGGEDTDEVKDWERLELAIEAGEDTDN